MRRKRATALQPALYNGSMYTPSSPHPAIEPWRWRVIWLMFLATMINYMDRQALGATSRFIKNEFCLTEEGYGWIEFWFGLAYGLFQVPAGFLSDRLHLRWLYAGALFLWSAAGFATGLAQSVVALMTCRIVLGIGEAFNWPCAVGIVRRIIPLESRGLANGIFHSGASIGAVLTPLVVLVVAPKGEHWRLVFQLIGALSLVWHFYRMGMPRFLEVELKFSSEGVKWGLAGFFLAADLGSMGAGYMTRRLARSGFSVERSRKLVLLGTSLLCLLSTPAALAM